MARDLCQGPFCPALRTTDRPGSIGVVAATALAVGVAVAGGGTGRPTSSINASVPATAISMFQDAASPRRPLPVLSRRRSRGPGRLAIDYLGARNHGEAPHSWASVSTVAVQVRGVHGCSCRLPVKPLPTGHAPDWPVPSSSLHDCLGRVRRVKAKPLRGRFASLDTAATAKGGQLRGGRGRCRARRAALTTPGGRRSVHDRRALACH